MTVKKKIDEQQELPLPEENAVPENQYEAWYNHHADILVERMDNVKNKLKELDKAMINKALALLEAAGNGSDDAKIKQIEKAIEIYKEVKAF